MWIPQETDGDCDHKRKQKHYPSQTGSGFGVNLTRRGMVQKPSAMTESDHRRSQYVGQVEPQGYDQKIADKTRLCHIEFSLTRGSPLCHSQIQKLKRKEASKLSQKHDR